jgi:hypothetical protein
MDNKGKHEKQKKAKQTPKEKRRQKQSKPLSHSESKL